MVSLKTKSSRTKRLFLIALIPLFGGALAFSSYSLIADSSRIGTVLVKDDSTVLPNAQDISSDGNAVEAPLATDNRPLVTSYTVVSGDTLSGIAAKFDISSNTIRWANDLTEKSSIRVGQTLTILPVTGIQYTVKKGDTISGIALKFDVKQSDILDFNDISGDKIVPGASLIIPDGEPIAPPKPVKAPATAKAHTVPKKEVAQTAPKDTTDEPSSSDYFINPLPGSILSQGLHDRTAVDMAAKVGSVVRAAADGTVITAKDSNTWNGGYGYYVVVQHDNGTQTLYAHLSRIDVEVGDEVEQGQAIALSGRTGHVTGPHLHFEVRGVSNPFAKDRVGTQY